MADKILRRPPAYQVYASDDLANEAYFGLTAGERGVLDSMQRACWVNDTVPSDRRLLAFVLHLTEVEETNAALPQRRRARPRLTGAATRHVQEPR